MIRRFVPVAGTLLVYWLPKDNLRTPRVVPRSDLRRASIRRHQPMIAEKAIGKIVGACT
jgi:hypothetical protein